MNDIELRELLSLADGHREPPADFEDELLRDVLAALTDDLKTIQTTKGALLLLPIIDDPNDIAPTSVEDVVANQLPATQQRNGRSVLILGMAAAAVFVALVFVSSLRNVSVVESVPAEQTPTSSEPTPNSTQPAETTSTFNELSDQEVCMQARTLILDSGFLGIERVVLDSEELAVAADLLGQLSMRELIEQEPSNAIVALRYASITSERSAADADAAHVRARAAVLSLRLVDLPCG